MWRTCAIYARFITAFALLITKSELHRSIMGMYGGAKQMCAKE